MSSTAYANLVAGIPTIGVIEAKFENRVRERFDPETGSPVNFNYKQIVVKVLGKEIPIKKKLLYKDYRQEYPQFGYKPELYDWCQRNGFCYEFLNFQHSYDFCSYVNGSYGILGICAWDYSSSDPSEYGSTGANSFRAFSLQEGEVALKRVKKLLKKIGCNKEPELFVVSRLT